MATQGTWLASCNQNALQPTRTPPTSTASTTFLLSIFNFMIAHSWWFDFFWCQRNLHKMTSECCSARTIWWISGQLPIQDFRRMVDFSSICSHGTSKGEINSKRQGTFRTLTVSPWLIENASGRTSSTDKPLYFFVIHKIGQHLTKLWILETTQPYEKWRETRSWLLMICLCNYRHKLVVLVNFLVTKLYE